MPGKQLRTHGLHSEAVGSKKAQSVSVLVVGDPGRWQKQGNPLPHGGMAFISFEEVTEAMLDRYNPTLVISPILAPSFDCIELSLLLHNIGFTGKYRAMAQDLPKPELVVREVSQMCPRLDFDIVIGN